MPPRSRKPESGDIELPGMQRRPGLIHLLTPESAGIPPNEFSDITPEMNAFAEPTLLRQSLIFDRPTKGRSIVSFRPASDRRFDRVYLALNPEDYNGVARSVDALGRTAINKTLEAYPKDERATDEVQGKAARSALHTVDGKLKNLIERTEVLEGRRHVISTFQEMARPHNRNLNRGPTIPSRFNELMSTIVDDVVAAVANQREYNEHGTELMRKTITNRLFVEGNFQDRADYFAKLLELADEYYGYCVALYKTRIHESKIYLRNGGEV